MINEFLRKEAAAGLFLFVMAIVAIIMSNTSLVVFYERILLTIVSITIGELNFSKPLLLWVNDGLMSIFFLLVGLEIKREIVEGQLSSRERVMLPAIAALGGLCCPAAIYIYINWGDPVALKGWAIPAATDIAFAVGVISLLSDRIPSGLKLVLLALAILDDIAAIFIIGIFYTHHLWIMSLALAGVGIVALALFNYMQVRRLAPYILLGVFIWVCVLKSGVHATLAGVLVAMFIPLQINRDGVVTSPLRDLEHQLHDWVAYLILPMFAFCNAGVSLSGLTLNTLTNPITMGISCGLILGKPIGVMLATGIAYAFGIVQLPERVTWKQYLGMACLTGIGFTMSLFIGTLAFDNIAQNTATRLGVLFGSTVSGLVGYILLRCSCRYCQDAALDKSQ